MRALKAGIAGFVIGAASGVVTGAAGNALYDFIRFTAERVELEPTKFNVSLADSNCGAGRIDGLVRQRMRQGDFSTDNLVEHTRVCANFRFKEGSINYVVHQLEDRFDQCFDLDLESSNWVLKLKQNSTAVCHSETLSQEGRPVYFCLVQAAAPDWTVESNRTVPRTCPEAVEAHFANRNAPPNF